MVTPEMRRNAAKLIPIETEFVIPVLASSCSTSGSGDGAGGVGGTGAPPAKVACPLSMLVPPVKLSARFTVKTRDEVILSVFAANVADISCPAL